MNTSATFEAFRSLNLKDDPGEIGFNGATTATNVDFDKRGRVRSRDGFANLTGVASAEPVNSFAVRLANTGSDVVLSVLNEATLQSDLEAYDSSGLLATSTTPSVAGAHYFARFGSGTTTNLYIANGTDQILRWNGTAFASPAGLAAQTGKFLGVTPWDNRLVHARTATNISRVAFSDEDTPETFTADNYVDLTPGDGGGITGVCAWRNDLFVFKAAKFFVFYGTSTDAEGDTRFDYRTVDAGQGITGDAAPAAPGPDGLYFVNQSGLYRTTGGPPELLSDRVESLFTEDTQFRGLVVVDWRVYVSGVFLIDGNTVSRILVYDLRTDDWFLWAPHSTMQFGHLAVYGPGPTLAAVESLGSTVMLLDPDVSADAGQAITTSYVTGFSDYGIDAEKTVREMEFWGTGSVSVSAAVDYSSTYDTASTLTLGTSPAVASARRRVAKRGTNVSVKFASTSGAWRVNRMTHYLRPGRAAGVKS